MIVSSNTRTRLYQVSSLILWLACAQPGLTQTNTGQSYNGRSIMSGQCYGDASRQGEFIENVIAVKLMPGKTAQDLTSLLNAYGASVIEPFDAYRWGRVEIAPTLTDSNYYIADGVHFNQSGLDIIGASAGTGTAAFH